MPRAPLARRGAARAAGALALAALAACGHAPPPPAAAGPGWAAERLDRAAVAVPGTEGLLLSWRLRADDDPRVRFVVERDGRRVHAEPQALTQWLDTAPARGGAPARYTVTALSPGRAPETAAVQVLDAPYLRVPLTPPPDARMADGSLVPYAVNDGSAADLDGDGRYEIVFAWQPANARDNSQPGATAPVLLEAVRLDGTRLWRIDLGPNIRAGAHYSPFVVYDLDGDGRAELMVRTADGTVDGTGRVLGRADARHANERGLVLAGPEFMSVFDGRTGAALAQADYLPPRGAVTDWGDDYGNRSDRFLAGVAHLDGRRPSALFSRGYYTRAVIAAWDWRDGRLSLRWLFDSEADEASRAARGQGAHWFAVSDVDGDGRDDIVYGAATIGADGRLRHSTGLGHGDALHVAPHDPQHGGQQVFMVHESPRAYGPHGISMHDAATGRLLWSHPGDGRDIGRGVCLDIDPAHPGNECWASVGPLFDARGRVIGSERPRAVNFGLWWDGSAQRQTLDGTRIARWQPAAQALETLLDGREHGAASNNGTKATPVLTADLLGDWREEVVWRSADNRALLVFTSPHATPHRRVTLMHDRAYRQQVAAQNAGYNQPPHPSTPLFPLFPLFPETRP